MIRKLSMILFVSGFCLLVYSGWNYYQGTQSVQQIPEETSTASADVTTDTTVSKQDNSNTEEIDTSADPQTLNYNIDKGTEVAKLDIPAMDKRFTTYWGADENTLNQGVGMYVSEWTTVPNREGGHTVLSGHRDTVFVGLDELDEGDILEVYYDGERFEYEIKRTWITDADDRTVIVEKEEPTLTLTTCYPFDYIGYAPERYIIEAALVE